MNQNPTTVNELPPGYEFTTTQLAAAGSRWETWRSNLIYSEVIVQHLSTTQGYWAGNTYGLTPAYGSSLFEAAYYGGVNGQPWVAAVKNIENLLFNLQEDPEANPNYLASARIWRALIYQRLTDIYGDIPYFQAARGYLDGNFTPWYTQQDSIYMDLHQELTEAVDQFDSGQPTYGNADLVFGGDIAKWQKFANSLRLRLALRLVKVRPDLAQQWAEEAVNHPAGVMESNDDIVVISHQDGPSGGPAGFNTNANSESFAVELLPRLSLALVDFMKDHDDPRLFVYGALVDTEVDTAMGFPNGYTAGTIDRWRGWETTMEDGEEVAVYEYDDFLALNPVFTDMDDPIFFQTYAEVEFMLAEAAVRGWNVPGSAAEHYEEGVRAAMIYLTMYDASLSIPAAEIDAYLAANPLAATPSEQLDQINTQYWAAIVLHGYEAWANWRRSGYPELDPAPVDLDVSEFDEPQPYTLGEIPRRLPYPVNEVNLNTEAYEAARTRQGIVEGSPSVLTAPVWWDCGDYASRCNTDLLGPQADPGSESNGPGEGPPGVDY